MLFVWISIPFVFKVSQNLWNRGDEKRFLMCVYIYRLVGLGVSMPDN